MNKIRINLLLASVAICISFVLISCLSKSGNISSNVPTTTLPNAAVPNTLTAEEIKDGWTLLFDGKTSAGWRAIYKNDFPLPSQGWVIENGELTALGSAIPDSISAGDIITDKTYRSFILKCEFKIKDNGDVGIKYFVNESLKSSPTSKTGLGLEYAIHDDKGTWRYPTPDYAGTCGSLFNMVRAPDSLHLPRPTGEWNQAVIIVNGNHIEHWLNGTKTVTLERFSEKYYELLAKSKYAKIIGFAVFNEGHILLQNELIGGSYRNIKIREL